MLYSVEFIENDGKKYYRHSRKKYHLENEGAVLDTIPSDTAERMQFYYYEENVGWIFDKETYEMYLVEVEEKNKNVQKNNTNITQDEMLTAMMELAQQISDLEDALVEVAAMVGGE